MVRLISAIVVTLLLGLQPANSAELVMFDSPACDWCEAWDQEVGVVYAKTDEAVVAPLRRMDIDDPREGPLANIRPVMYTPTFVMMDKGKEVGRIMGYPGEDNFWWLLGELVGKVSTPVSGCPTNKSVSADHQKGLSC
jgi:thioredoxin-related protein